ncbi:hypothetical protein B5807_01782 [Epicoccum nigrum]|uniref:PABC domain-containing protein n=1 Tax=Epicoccum nigrum TaxID=105696 RepID=A0A1Y2MDC6_EPING|nr:hypothetical protein B5807_01782 [Epicoccum nigrum]
MEDIDMDSPTVTGTAGLDIDALFAAPPEEQKQMLLEAILPMVFHLPSGLADKICGMVLEKDINELVQLAFDESDLRAEIEKIAQLYAPNPDEDGRNDKMEINASEGKPPDPRS